MTATDLETPRTHRAPAPRRSDEVDRAPDGGRRGRLTASLVQKIADCPDPTQRRRLQDELATVNLGVARSIASRYYGRGISAEDLDQVAALALVKAVRRFDPTASEDLLRFAVPTIAGELKRHFRDHGWMVRPPRRITDLLPTVNRAIEDLRASLGREPRPSQIAGGTGLPLADVVEVLTTDGLFAPDSLDAPVGTDGGEASRHDVIGAEDTDFDLRESLIDLEQALHVLDDRERKVLRLRYYEDLSQEQIGAAIGVSQMQVSRILTTIHRKLHALMDDEVGESPSGDVCSGGKLVQAC